MIIHFNKRRKSHKAYLGDIKKRIWVILTLLKEGFSLEEGKNRSLARQPRLRNDPRSLTKYTTRNVEHSQQIINKEC